MVEVVVGILNKDCGDKLRACLSSLIKQTFHDMVVVVVDGGSKDNSLEVIKEFAKSDSRIKFIIQKSKGTGMARNELIDYVRLYYPEAEFIVWGDAENIYPPNYLESLLRVNSEIIGGINIIDSNSPLSQALWWYYNGFKGQTFVGNNVAVKTSTYEKIRYLPITKTEDFFFQKAASKMGIKAVKVKDAVCYIKTVESLREFIKWEKSRAKGLWEGSKMTGSTKTLWLTYLFTSIISTGYIIITPVLLALQHPILLIPYILTLILASAYLWFKGKMYVKKMRWGTFLFFVPLSLMDSLAVLVSLIKINVSKSRGMCLAL